MISFFVSWREDNSEKDHSHGCQTESMWFNFNNGWFYSSTHNVLSGMNAPKWWKITYENEIGSNTMLDELWFNMPTEFKLCYRLANHNIYMSTENQHVTFKQGEEIVCKLVKLSNKLNHYQSAHYLYISDAYQTHAMQQQQQNLWIERGGWKRTMIAVKIEMSGKIWISFIEIVCVCEWSSFFWDKVHLCTTYFSI